MKLDQAKEILTGITNNPKSCLYSQRTAIQTVLDALDKAGTLPKIAIDYSKVETCEAPFDGNDYLLHADESKYIAHFDKRTKEFETYGGEWITDYCAGRITHYTPMPEFYETKGGEV